MNKRPIVMFLPDLKNMVLVTEIILFLFLNHPVYLLPSLGDGVCYQVIISSDSSMLPSGGVLK